ncbi:MAG TPA: hypothetical protein VD970_10370 [Acetobacteraceae bacterium]|nr:hypothetical protein [Acetobacteraceae bacterium]
MARRVIPSSLLVTIDRLAKCRAWGRVTRAGVAFDYSWATEDTASFLLIREPHHSDEDIDAAVQEIAASGESAGPVRVARLDVAGARPPGPAAGLFEAG